MRDLNRVADRVADAIREVSGTIIEPRFKALAEQDVEEKSPGELVTVADREAEAALSARLSGIVPGAPVVGEEACAEDPDRLGWLGAERAWLVDALDGTANFVAGSSDWAVMVALLADRYPIMSWIWQPATRRMYVAERGAGGRCNGTEMKITSTPKMPGDLRGAALTGFMEPTLAATVAANSPRYAAVGAGRRCCGTEYPAVIEGEQDFALYWRTLPWDHVPAVLLLEEAGGVARRPDGAPFLPYHDGQGLLIARDDMAWDGARHILDPHADDR